LLQRILQVVEETRTLVRQVQSDVDRLKLVVNRGAESTSDLDDLIFEHLRRPMTSHEELEEFCNKLEKDLTFRQAAVSIHPH
jgi:propanediol dehydratase small subunit